MLFVTSAATAPCGILLLCRCGLGHVQLAVTDLALGSTKWHAGWLDRICRRFVFLKGPRFLAFQCREKEQTVYTTRTSRTLSTTAAVALAITAFSAQPHPP